MCGYHVASFAEAWIEIRNLSGSAVSDTVASFAEAWIEIAIALAIPGNVFGRLLRGGVD